MPSWRGGGVCRGVASPLTTLSGQQDCQYQNNGSDNGNDQPLAVAGDLLRCCLLQLADDRKAFDHGPHVWGTFQLFGKIPSRLVGSLVIAVFPQRTGADIVDRSVDCDVGRTSVAAILSGKLAFGHCPGSCRSRS